MRIRRFSINRITRHDDRYPIKCADDHSIDLGTGVVISDLTRSAGPTWNRTITQPANYHVHDGRPGNPLSLGLLVRAATQLPTIEGAGRFESVYIDQGPSWTIEQPAQCSAFVDEIAPLATGGYLVTLRPSPTTGDGIYPYVLHPDGTVQALPTVDTTDASVDVQPTPDGLNRLRRSMEQSPRSPKAQLPSPSVVA